MLNNQSCLEDFGLVEELDEQATETISGGYNIFTLRNKTGYDIDFTLDGGSFLQKANAASVYTTYSGGLIIEFDADVRIDYKQFKKYALGNGGVYEFQEDQSVNPYGIELYVVG